jgi:spore coat polysaccharide biosynthesis predicted glycosyltransferase SpsG
VTLLVRPDVGADVGLGHLRRCLTVAEALREQGVASAFLLPPGPGAELARAEGFRVEAATAEPGTTADLGETAALAGSLGAAGVFVDSYAAGEEFLGELVRSTPLVAAFDDRCLHPFPCRLVVNGGLGAEHRPYTSSSGATDFLLGAAYAPLRRAYWNGPPARGEAGAVPRVLVVFGGADLSGHTPAAVAALDGVEGPIRVVAAVGPLAGNLAEVEAAAAGSPHEAEVVHDPPDFTSLVAGADLAISAGGGTLVELVAAGTPAIAVEIAENQRPGIEALLAAGAIEHAGRVDDPGLAVRLQALVQALLADGERRAALTRAGRSLLDGRGALRIAARLAALVGPQ